MEQYSIQHHLSRISQSSTPEEELTNRLTACQFILLPDSEFLAWLDESPSIEAATIALELSNDPAVIVAAESVFRVSNSALPSIPADFRSASQAVLRSPGDFSLWLHLVRTSERHGRPTAPLLDRGLVAFNTLRLEISSSFAAFVLEVAEASGRQGDEVAARQYFETAIDHLVQSEFLWDALIRWLSYLDAAGGGEEAAAILGRFLEHCSDRLTEISEAQWLEILRIYRGEEFSEVDALFTVAVMNRLSHAQGRTLLYAWAVYRRTRGSLEQIEEVEALIAASEAAEASQGAAEAAEPPRKKPRQEGVATEPDDRQDRVAEAQMRQQADANRSAVASESAAAVLTLHHPQASIPIAAFEAVLAALPGYLPPCRVGKAKTTTAVYCDFASVAEAEDAARKISEAPFSGERVKTEVKEPRRPLANTVCMKNLPWGFDEVGVRKFLSEINVVKAEVGRDYAIVEVGSAEDAGKALGLSGRRMHGRVVTVELSTRAVKVKDPEKKVNEGKGLKGQDFFRNMFN